MSKDNGETSPQSQPSETAPSAPTEPSADPKDVQTQTSQVQEYDNRPCFFKFITAIARTWGLLTCAAIWFLTVKMIQNKKHLYIQWYCLGMSIVVTLMELVWIMNKCACCRDDGACCCACWRVILWFDNWKKSVLYILLAAPTLSRGNAAPLAIICGALVMVLAIFYLFKTCKYSDCVKNKKKETQFIDTECPKANLVSHEVQTMSSDYSAAGQTYTTLQEASDQKDDVSKEQ